jgi:cytochrome c551/c552
MSRPPRRIAGAAAVGATGRAVAGSLLAGAALLLAAGCGASGASSGARSTAVAEPSYAQEPFTGQERRVERGARLYVADGCSACHAIGGRRGLGPSFAKLAGSRVTLADGRRVLVSERFLRAALVDPAGAEVRGYPAAPMLAAVRRLALAGNPAAVAALAAFIEQIGPETP